MIYKTENALNMFSNDNILVFFIRVINFFQVFTTFPLIFHGLRTQFTIIVFGKNELKGLARHLINAVPLLIYFIVASTFTSLGQLVGIAGGFLGLFLMYLIPVALHV